SIDRVARERAGEPVGMDRAVAGFQAGVRAGGNPDFVVDSRVVGSEIQESEEPVPVGIDGLDPDLVPGLSHPDLRQTKSLFGVATAGGLNRAHLQVWPIPRHRLDPAVDVLHRNSRNPFHRKGLFADLPLPSQRNGGNQEPKGGNGSTHLSSMNSNEIRGKRFSKSRDRPIPGYSRTPGRNTGRRLRLNGLFYGKSRRVGRQPIG